MNEPERYDTHALKRIGELADAIMTEYEKKDYDIEKCHLYADEIGWLCAMVESLKENNNADD
jgi:hypothetical protein